MDVRTFCRDGIPWSDPPVKRFARILYRLKRGTPFGFHWICREHGICQISYGDGGACDIHCQPLKKAGLAVYAGVAVHVVGVGGVCDGLGGVCGVGGGPLPKSGGEGCLGRTYVRTYSKPSHTSGPRARASLDDLPL